MTRETTYTDPKGILSRVVFEQDADLDELAKKYYFYGKDGDAAALFVKLYPDAFRVAKLEKKNYEFYYFNTQKHRWCLDGSSFLLSLLEGDFTKKMKEYEDIMTQWIQSNVASRDQNACTTKVVFNMMNKRANIKSRNFYNNMLNWLYEYYYKLDVDFISKLDISTTLLAFTNGVYELDTDNFRVGIPSDYIFTGLAVDYKRDVSDERVKVVDEWFDSIFPEMPDVKEYFLWYLASGLDGSNRHQLFAFGTGSGGNGKSAVLKLLTKLFGDGLCLLPINMFTSEPPSAETASPYLATLKGKYFGVIADMASKNTLYTGLVKTISGNDPIVARKLHGSPIKFISRCLLLFMVNDLPEKLDDTSDGTLRKIQVIPFIQRFVKKEDYDPINKPWLKLADDTIEQRLLQHIEEFAVLLIRKYSQYRKTGYKMPNQPELIKEATRKYKESTNLAEKYIRDHIIIQNHDCNLNDLQYLCFDDIKESVEKYGVSSKKMYAALDKATNYRGNAERKWRFPKDHARENDKPIRGWKGMYFVAEKESVSSALE